MGIMFKLMKHRNLLMDLNKTPQQSDNSANRNKSDQQRLITIEGDIITAPKSQSNKTVKDNLSKNVDTNVDKQFTAEHIIQLCKFLAEKSKRNKNLYKQQQSPKKINKSKQTQFQFQQIEYHGGNVDGVNDDDEEADFYQNEALSLLNTQRQQKQPLPKKNVSEDSEFEEQRQLQQKTCGVLSSRLSPDINSLNISSNTLTNACALQYHNQHQQQQQQQQHHHQFFNYQYHHHHQQQQQQIQEQQEPQYNNQGKRDILLKIRRQIFERKRLRLANGACEAQVLNNAQVWRPW